MKEQKKIITIGGGVAGTEVSSVLANLGYEVTILEKSGQSGGKLNNWNHLFPNGRPASEVNSFLLQKIHRQTFRVLYNTSVNRVIHANGAFAIETTTGQQLQANAVVISTGFETFDAARKEEYGYSIYENVITSVDLEEIMKKGQTLTTSQGTMPKRIAFIHCVGSRDEKSGHHHCSKVCCITGVKQAIELAKQLPDTEIYCFYMDLRMFGLQYESLYREAQEKYNIQFIRGRLSEASENQDESLLIKAEDTLSGRPLKMNVDLMVLLVGMIPGRETSAMSGLFGLEREPNGFLNVRDPHINKNRSSIEGVFLAGTCTGPMTVDETLEHARSAALDIHQYLQSITG
jgi:heterodisulfide reductase subunit A